MRATFHNFSSRAAAIIFLCLSAGLTGCIETVPDELVDAIEAVDRDLVSLRAGDVSPKDYSHFVQHWIALKGQVQSEENLVRWPWEENGLESDLEQLHGMGSRGVVALRAALSAAGLTFRRG